MFQFSGTTTHTEFNDDQKKLQEKYENILKKYASEISIKTLVDLIYTLMECHSFGHQYAILALHYEIGLAEIKLGPDFKKELKKAHENFSREEITKAAILKNPCLALLNEIYLKKKDTLHDHSVLNTRTWNMEIEFNCQALKLFPLNSREKLVDELTDNKSDPYIEKILIEVINSNNGNKRIAESKNNTSEERLSLSEKYPLIKSAKELENDKIKDYLKFLSKDYQIDVNNCYGSELYKYEKYRHTYSKVNLEKITQQDNSNTINKEIDLEKHYQFDVVKKLSTVSFPVEILCPSSLSSTVYALYRLNHSLMFLMQCEGKEKNTEKPYILALTVFKLYNIMVNLERNKIIWFKGSTLLKMDNFQVDNINNLYKYYDSLRKRLLNEIYEPENPNLLFEDIIKELCTIIKSASDEWINGLSISPALQIEPDVTVDKTKKEIISQLNKCYNNLVTQIENHMKNENQQTKCLVM